MLIKTAILKRIKSGEVTLAFRRWRRPTVKSGGTLRTAIGELAIERVTKTTTGKITDRDARRAGYESRAALLADLRRRSTNVAESDT